LRYPAGKAAKGGSVLLAVLDASEAGTTPGWLDRVVTKGQMIVLCEPRGVGATRWTRKNPPNYVERSHALLGRTVDAGRVWDVIAAARALPTHSRFGGGQGNAPVAVYVAGSKAAGVLGAYAAVLDEHIAGAVLVSPPASHMS